MAWDLRQSKTVESHPHPCAADRKIHLPLFLFSYLKIFGFPLRDVLCLHWCHLILPLFKHPHTSINILDMWLGKLKPLLRQSSGPRGRSSCSWITARLQWRSCQSQNSPSGGPSETQPGLPRTAEDFPSHGSPQQRSAFCPALVCAPGSSWSLRR